MKDSIRQLAIYYFMYLCYVDPCNFSTKSILDFIESQEDAFTDHELITIMEIEYDSAKKKRPCYSVEEFLNQIKIDNRNNSIEEIINDIHS